MGGESNLKNVGGVEALERFLHCAAQLTTYNITRRCIIISFILKVVHDFFCLLFV